MKMDQATYDKLLENVAAATKTTLLQWAATVPGSKEWSYDDFGEYSLDADADGAVRQAYATEIEYLWANNERLSEELVYTEQSAGDTLEAAHDDGCLAAWEEWTGKKWNPDQHN